MQVEFGSTNCGEPARDPKRANARMKETRTEKCGNN